MVIFWKKIYRNIREFIKKTEMFKRFEHFVVNNYFKCTFGVTKEGFEANTQNFSYPRKVNIDGINFEFFDIITSNTVEYVKRELEKVETYDFKNLNFSPGDVVIDIGANVGIVSIYLAKKFPFLKIYSYEPVTQNFQNFMKNINFNNIPEGIIFPYNLAVTKDGRKVQMGIIADNSGGSTLVENAFEDNCMQICNSKILSTTLEDIVKQNNIEELKLLKIDCEGSEYEILYNTPKEILKNIKILRGEFHDSVNPKYNIDDLSSYVKQYINDVKYEECRRI